jgi:cyclophilin family peptidyl-prolyl cis-trans isomerase
MRCSFFCLAIVSALALQGSSGSAQPPAGAAAGAAADFPAIFGDWKALLKQMRELKLRYQSAPPDELPQLEQQWEALIAKGNELLPKLRDSGLEAYKAAPNADEELTRFLVSVAEDATARDAYETALTLGDVLIENGAQHPHIYNSAGIAAFSQNDFDRAGEYFAEARNAGALTDDGTKLAAFVEEYKKLWAEEQKLREAEAAVEDPEKQNPRVRLETSKGVIEAELFEDQAPGTVGNFISLIEKGFYDGLTFHRVLPGFMAQGGCPRGDGSGGPDYAIYDECRQDNARMHFRGSLSMAKTAAPNSGGSQFFITFRPTPTLNGEHTVFGRVVSGWDVLEKIQRRDPDQPGSPAPDKTIKAEVLRKRSHEYVPNKVAP